MKKLDEGRFDAIILAAAGVMRLGWHERITEVLPPGISLPAIGQGAVGIECRAGDDFINNLTEALNHEETSVCVRAERAFLKRLEGGCQVPVGAYARLINGKIVMEGLVGSVSGERIIREQMEGDQDVAESIGIRLAENLLSRGAKEILDSVYGRDLAR